jgi:hypothetical protein
LESFGKIVSFGAIFGGFFGVAGALIGSIGALIALDKRREMKLAVLSLVDWYMVSRKWPTKLAVTIVTVVVNYELQWR